MKCNDLSLNLALGLMLAGLVAGSAFAAPPGSEYVQTDLVSDGAVPANTIDPNLKNPWGVAFFPGLSPFWVADNNAGVSTLYDGLGVPFAALPLVDIPTPAASIGGTPTGLVANIFFAGFPVPNTGGQPSFFIFDTEDGTIVGWTLTSGTQAVIAVDNSAAGAVYKGLAIGINGQGKFLYATNFHSGQVEVYDDNFEPATLSGSFTDPKLPKGYAPFGIQNINGSLYVTYAVQDAAKHDDVSGPAHGIVDIFDTNGNLIRRFLRHGHLNSPWGVAMAPASFRRFANDILVGNFGDGRIDAYDPVNGAFAGNIRDTANRPIVIDGLWTLTFGGALGSSPSTLYFTAGLNDEQDGLFGSIAPQ